MGSSSRTRVAASLLLSLLSLGTSGLVFSHYAGMYGHIRSWEVPGANWNTPLGAFRGMTSPPVSALVAGLIAVSMLAAWAARRPVRHRPPSERLSVAAAAARLSAFSMMLAGLALFALICVLSVRVRLVGWPWQW